MPARAPRALPTILSASRARIILVLAASCMPTAAAGAQVWNPAPTARPTTLRPEVRLDHLGGSGALHAGVGLSTRAGNYVRLGANAGAAPDALGGVRERAHADVTARFLIDPYRQLRIGASIGGGVSVRYQDDRVRSFALLVADVEAGRSRGWAPFLRVGIGGGARLTAGMRRGATAGR